MTSLKDWPLAEILHNNRGEWLVDDQGRTDWPALLLLASVVAQVFALIVLPLLIIAFNGFG